MTLLTSFWMNERMLLNTVSFSSLILTQSVNKMIQSLTSPTHLYKTNNTQQARPHHPSRPKVEHLPMEESPLSSNV